MQPCEPLVPPTVGTVRFDTAKSLWLWGMIVPGLVWGVPALSLSLTLISLVTAFLTLCLGHSVGLHRGIIHHTYDTSPLCRGWLAWLFVLSGLGGPLTWAQLHAVRDYWQNQTPCPRYFDYRPSLWKDFGWNLHFSFHASDQRANSRMPGDIFQDRWLRFLEKTWPLHVLSAGVITFFLGGAEAVAVVICLRTAVGIIGHWFVGYCAHRWGESRYEIDHASVCGTNLWTLGVISFGEGFHNNHHAFPHSARIGLLPHEWDLGWWCIRLMERLGLIFSVRTADPAEIIKHRILHPPSN